MGTRSKLIWTTKIFAGQYSGMNPELEVPSKGELYYNFYVQNGALKKIPGSSLYLHSALGSDPIAWMDSYRRRLMFQLGTNLAIETSEGSQTELLLANDFNQARLFSEKWQDSIFLANGIDLRSYDGSIVRNIGILPMGNGRAPRPVSNFSAVASNTAGNLLTGTYKYTLTLWDANSEVESLPYGALVGSDALFNAGEFDSDNNPLGYLYAFGTVILPNDTMILTFPLTFKEDYIADADINATHIRLYRAFDDGTGFTDYRLHSQYLLDRGIPLNLRFPSTIFDNTAEADLGEILLTEDLIPPPRKDATVNAGSDTDQTSGPRFMRAWRDSLFFFGSRSPEYDVDVSEGTTQTVKNFSADSILYASDTNQPDYIAANWNVGSGDGQSETGLALVNNNLVIFKESSIYILDGTFLNDFVVKVQDERRGCVAPGSLQETPFGAVFLSSAGVALFGGTGNAKIISDEILDEIQNINQSALSEICSSYDSDSEIYTLYAPQGTTSRNNRQLVYSFKDQAWSVGRRRREITSATIIDKENASQVSLIGVDAGGYILNISSREVVSDYDDLRITSIWRSSEISLGNEDDRKKVVWLYVTARCAISWIIDVRIYSDDWQSGLPVFEYLNVNSESDIALYAASENDPDGAVYDESLYVGEQTTKRLKIPVSGIGRQFFVEITERSNNPERHSFDLLSVTLEGVSLSR